MTQRGAADVISCGKRVGGLMQPSAVYVWPAKLILGKAAARIIDDDPVRQVRPPLPKDKIMMVRRRARHKARHEDATMPFGTKPINHKPGRRVAPLLHMA